MQSALSSDSMHWPSQNRNVVTGMSLNSVGDLHVTGTAFTSTLSSRFIRFRRIQGWLAPVATRSSQSIPGWRPHFWET
jgi:hypothetical protein